MYVEMQGGVMRKLLSDFQDMSSDISSLVKDASSSLALNAMPGVESKVVDFAVHNL